MTGAKTKSSDVADAGIEAALRQQTELLQKILVALRNMRRGIEDLGEGRQQPKQKSPGGAKKAGQKVPSQKGDGRDALNRKKPAMR